MDTALWHNSVLMKLFFFGIQHHDDIMLLFGPHFYISDTFGESSIIRQI